LNHLLHDALPDDANRGRLRTTRPAGLFNKFRLYPFQDIPAAYENLDGPGHRKTASTPLPTFSGRDRSPPAPAIAATPEPDTTLVTLSRVSDSLGGKAALWELLSTNKPSLNLYVTLCAACPYLAGILTSNPGMIDELMDSLLVEHLPTLAILEEALAELCKGAEDIDPILHSFKNAQHLRVGVRDVLGKDDVRSTHAALADIAEACLKQIATREYGKLVEKFGVPTIGRPSDEDLASDIVRQHWQRLRRPRRRHLRAGRPALGAPGGREPNYHSDLDLIFLYEAGGQTVGRNRGHSRPPVEGGGRAARSTAISSANSASG
jgi:glutamate-ammonia-ligase adenylyltransferase